MKVKKDHEVFMENGLAEKVLITKSIPELHQLVKYLYSNIKQACQKVTKYINALHKLDCARPNKFNQNQ